MCEHEHLIELEKIRIESEAKVKELENTRDSFQEKLRQEHIGMVSNLERSFFEKYEKKLAEKQSRIQKLEDEIKRLKA
jgi:predicted RNase H-like nuclease (RuvC/YqgF family)